MLSMIVGMYFLAAVQAVQAPPSTCLPPFWGGVLAGSSTKEHVVGLYGQGILAPDEGDSGGSYYRDAKGTITLHAVYYTDQIVGTLEVIEGNALPPNARQRPEAVSPFLKPPFLHAGRAFGATEEAVVSSMGQPTRKEKEEDGLTTFVYLSDCHCELESGISFVFRKGRLFKVVYWHEPG
jgi:hypothetical protein